MRIDRSIGTWLVLLPGWWGLALAAAPGALPDPLLLALFGIGAFTMRGAGCTVNDMWDRDFDGKVARTAQRPLATGRITPFRALQFLGAQLSAGLGVLLCLNWPTIKLGAFAVPLTATYPALKRWTHLPQAVLGLAMNYGILMGYTAATGVDLLPALLPAAPWGDALASLTIVSSTAQDASAAAACLPAAVSLYAGAALWTVVYDTIYAHQDKADDAALGLKSTALLFGEHSRAILTGLAVASGALWSATGVLTGLAWPYYAAVAGSVAHQLWQVRTADFDGSRENLTRRFVSNKHIGWLMLAGLVAGRLFQI